MTKLLQIQTDKLDLHDESLSSGCELYMLNFNIDLPTRLLMTAYHCEYHMHYSSSFCCRSADLYLGAEEIEMGASNNKPSKPLLELTSIKDLFVYVTVYICYGNISHYMHPPATNITVKEKFQRL